MKNKITDEQVILAAQQSKSMQEAARKLNISLGTFRYKARNLGVYNPTPNAKGKINISEARRIYIESNTFSLEKILNGDYPSYRGHMLKHRLYESGLKEEKCEECGQGNMWNDKRLVLELEHINGNKTDHRWENLKILCPHCHSQTPTYKRKKKALTKINK